MNWKIDKLITGTMASDQGSELGYKVMAAALVSLSIAIALFAVAHRPADAPAAVLHKYSIVCVAAALIVGYRFFLGKKRGHVILFVNIFISLAISMECYMGVCGSLPLIFGMALVAVLIVVTFGLSHYLNQRPDCNYFLMYFQCK